MKHRRILAGLAALVLTLGLAGCGGQSAASGAITGAASDAPAAPEAASSQAAEGNYPVTIANYDYAGNEVSYTYEKAPERVVAVYQGSIETMIALEDVFAPDKETVTLLQPDLILSWGSLFSEKNLGDVSAWHEKGAATYINSNTRAGGHPRTLENEYADILNLGSIFNVEDRAEALVDEMKSAVSDTLASVEGRQPVRAAVVEPIGGGITNYGANSLAGDMVAQLGGVLVQPEGSEMSKENLVTADPDVIFVVYMAYSGEDPETVVANQLAVINEDPALASLSAVREGRVYPIMLGDIYAAGPRTIDGIRTIAAGMYGDAAA